MSFVKLFRKPAQFDGINHNQIDKNLKVSSINQAQTLYSIHTHDILLTRKNSSCAWGFRYTSGLPLKVTEVKRLIFGNNRTILMKKFNDFVFI